MPKVSIIIPSYNHGEFLSKRLDSIINQTYTDWELIIIDDKSSDDSIAILDHFVDNNKSRVKYFIKNEINSGSGYKSWQKGIDLAKTEYIWIAETDDYSDINFLEHSVKVLNEKENAALVFCNSNYVNEREQFQYNSSKRTKSLNVEKDGYSFFKSKVLLDSFPFNSFITNGSSAVFRNPKKKIPDQVFNNKQLSDIFLWTFLIKGKEFAFLNSNLNFFRRHSESTTNKIAKRKTNLVYTEIINYFKFFNIKTKNEEYIKHYIKHHVWKNKKKWFNLELVKQLKGDKNYKWFYCKSLFRFMVSKI